MENSIEQALSLLKQLIAIKSYSGQEEGTASLLENHLQSNGYRVERIQNNVLARGKKWAEGAPVLLLNSHHDTVQVTSNWDTDPFEPVEMSKLHGLGSNDAGAPLVCLLHTFIGLTIMSNRIMFFFWLLLKKKLPEQTGFQ